MSGSNTPKFVLYSKTVIVNVLIALGTYLLDAASGFNWVEYVGESPAVLIVTVLNMLLRLITSRSIKTTP